MYIHWFWIYFYVIKVVSLVKPGWRVSGFLKLFLCRHLYVCVFVCVFVCPPQRVLIPSGMMWHNMESIWLVIKFLQYSVSLSMVGIAIELKQVTEINLVRLSYVSCYKPLLHIYSCLKQLYISNKMEWFSFQGEYGVHGSCTHTKGFKRRAGLGHR